MGFPCYQTALLCSVSQETPWPGPPLPLRAAALTRALQRTPEVLIAPVMGRVGLEADAVLPGQLQGGEIKRVRLLRRTQMCF